MDIRWLGRMEYLQALDIQRSTHAEVAAGEAPDTLLLVEHEPVFTAGRRTRPEDRPPAGAPVIDVDRGGEITWHGPGQLTGYPILRLPALAGGSRDGIVDVVSFVRRVEELMITVCASFGVATERVEGRSGVWVRTPGRPDAKVGAVGIRVARSVTMHGFAINADCDLDAFTSFVPCGIRDAGVTSLTEQAGRDITVEAVRVAVTRSAGLLQGTLVS